MLKRFWLPLLVPVTAVLAGCGSGGDGSVGIGQGQDPDPVAPDFPIAYTKGPLFDEDDDLQASTDLRDTQRFNVGTDLYMRDRASPSAVERNITLRETEGLGDVQGVEISADGKKILFSMRGPALEGVALDDPDQPHWGIWEYTIETDTLRRLITADITFEAGHDMSPHYLPDGRIIFTSTRQRQSKAILLDENKPQFEALDEDRNDPAHVLHVMSDTGDAADLRQVSYNQSNDFDPVVLESGKIMFSRWDHAGSTNAINLYRMNPDGTELELLYGARSHFTGTDNGEVQFIGAREMQDGRVMAIVRPFDHPELGGAITIIDTETYLDNTQPTADFPGMRGPAQTPATPNDVRTDDLPSQGGRFSSAFPLWDGTGRVLVSWAICRLDETDPANPTRALYMPCTDELLEDPEASTAPPLYGIWMYDPVTETQKPIVIGEEGVLIGDVVAAQPRSNPSNIADKQPGVDLDSDLVNAGIGILNIRSVYDIDGVAAVNIANVANSQATNAAQRPARFLRVEKAVSLPDEDIVDLDNTAFGPNITQGMREIVAYAPIEPDGSVRVKVPARVALAISVLDANGRRISPRHQNWLQVMPGQELECNGCHALSATRSHGRADAFDSAYPGASGTGVPFPSTRSIYSPDVGETMAEVRSRIEAAIPDATDLVCPPRRSIEPSVNLHYCDAWTNPAVRAPFASFSYDYTALTTPAPVAANCIAAWSPNCRIVISYESIIHPLWSTPRQVVDPMTMTVVADHTCARSGCHAPVDALAQPMVPAGQLDLTDGLSADEPTQFNAYRELLFSDNRQILMNSAVVDEQIVIGSDAAGNPITAPVSIGSPMTSAGARASTAFFSRFDAGGTHAGRMSAAELRLVSEWLDIGAQYCNNPFATTGCPVN
jgi:hypothetical protein